MNNLFFIEICLFKLSINIFGSNSLLNVSFFANYLIISILILKLSKNCPKISQSEVITILIFFTEYNIRMGQSQKLGTKPFLKLRK